jgi:hypothetical protein
VPWLRCAFHKGLDKNKKHFLGLGVQLGYTNKSLKWQQLAFPSQFNGQDFDLTQNNGENFNRPNVGYFDMQAGILHQSTIKDFMGIMTGLYGLSFSATKGVFFGR